MLATTATAIAERLKRRRVRLGAAATLAVALVVGLGSVLAVQRRANTEMAAANGKLAAKNDDLEAERAKVEQRFDMARKAIAAFHTTIDEQQELGNEAFRPLRTKLLTAAAGFYRELEVLLANEADPKSRAALADGYFQLAELTVKIGDQTEALAVYRKALALRRELAAHLRARDLRQKLADANPTVTAFQNDLAQSHIEIGIELQDQMGKPTEALAAFREALAIRQKVYDANPTVIAFKSDLANSYYNIGVMLRYADQPEESLAASEKARDIYQELADANPAVNGFQGGLAASHQCVAWLLGMSGKREESLAADQKALMILQKLADANPAVTQFQSDLAQSHYNIGRWLEEGGQPRESLAAKQRALEIYQKLADANPTVPSYRSDLASIENSIGRLHAKEGRFAEAFVALDAGLAIREKLVAADTKTTDDTNYLGYSHACLGWARVRAGQPKEAADDLLKAVELWAKTADPDAEDLFEQARALALLANLGADPKSSVTADETKGFADRAAATLAEAIKAGWVQPAELRKPDFDAVRDRADFQKLQVEMAAARRSDSAE